MKSSRILAGVVCVVLGVLVFSPYASADTVCKANEAPCSKANAWPLETQFEAKIKTGSEFIFEGLRTWKCSASSRADRLLSNPVGAGAGAADGVGALSETFSGCSNSELGGSCTATTGALPESFKWVADAEAPGIGHPTLDNTAGTITFNCPFLNCKFLFWETFSHDYEGGSPAIESLEAMYVRSGESHFLCGNEITVSGKREIVSPSSSPVYWTLG